MAVRLLQYCGIIAWMAQYLDVVFRYMGLPGATAIAFLTGASVTTYASLAVLLSMELTLREATIVSIMVLICHALPLESAVVKRVGSNPWKMALLRIIAAFLAAMFLNAVLPKMGQPFMSRPEQVSSETVWTVMEAWLLASMKLSLMIYALIYILMAVQRLLSEFGVMPLLERPLRPVMLFFGLPENAAYLWLVGNVLGISYGSAMMLDLEDSGAITREEANEVNYHLIMNHSMLEDTLVFAAVGIPAFWILLTRMLFAFILVWGRRLLKKVNLLRA
ncbi:MAG: nucleoside recognition protein [Bacteroidales bacterium]|nr:nucleoside recognition protein [Bacteroidales bacterium]MCM1147052.1 nucleoside recognition protein [Bacteroidales bacterium]MCM1205815.1 nucleoside recognition protein [Bacillota bacterium]MCM1509942.1 hypothetical protein [Clostridium sp.]